MNRKDDAVSPVIGTILLVAVVVILAAIVAAIALGMVGGGHDPKSVGMTVTSDHRDATVTLFSGIDVSALEELRVFAANGNAVSRTDSAIKSIGVPLVFKNIGSVVAGPTLVTVTGRFTDGTEVVLWEGNLNVESLPFSLHVEGNSLFVSLPSDWGPTDVLNSEAGYGRKIIVELWYQDGTYFQSFAKGEDYVTLETLKYNLNQPYKHGDILSSLSPGTYTAKVYSQKVSIGDPNLEPLLAIGPVEYHYSQQITKS